MVEQQGGKSFVKQWGLLMLRFKGKWAKEESVKRKLEEKIRQIFSPAKLLLQSLNGGARSNRLRTAGQIYCNLDEQMVTSRA